MISSLPTTSEPFRYQTPQRGATDKERLATSASYNSHHAVQDGVRDERKNEGGIRDDKAFSGGMWDKKFSPGTGFAHFDRWDAG